MDLTFSHPSEMPIFCPEKGANSLYYSLKDPVISDHSEIKVEICFKEISEINLRLGLWRFAMMAVWEMSHIEDIEIQGLEISVKCSDLFYLLIMLGDS